MSEESGNNNEGAGVATGIGTAFVATKLIDICFCGGMVVGGPVGASVGLCVAVGLLALGVVAGNKSDTKTS